MKGREPELYELRIYLCGALKGGIPSARLTVFRAGASLLRSLGARVHCPAEIRIAHGWDPAHPDDFDPSDAIAENLAALLTCDLIALLPDWESTGEAATDVLLGDAFGIPAARMDAILAEAQQGISQVG